ncbi:MAG: YibE/F family protein [Inconstantimicrobium porci]|uniref:YibE/F family protein n=1 Tax=Inconstantimicrobium porci TaxID=2652291 RepID=UPI002A909B8D|nr:YibE/F family protein [Inconstantimicrobium porci]MDY5910635.1 YibE/F family protein [Inconstantimicrobium porci]
MKVIVNINQHEDNILISVYSYDRSKVIYAFVGMFLAILWAIGGKKGLKSAIALIFTFICIIYLFLPMLYKGYSPFLSAVILIILITIVSLYLIDGIIILNYAYDLRYNQIINMYDIGIEIMQGVSGSIAVILSVPLVSLIAALILTYKKEV